MNNVFNKSSILALLSAFLYGISIPLSKIILSHGVQPLVLGGLSYFGAGLGLLILNFAKIFTKEEFFKNPLTKHELPYTIAMVVLDILAISILMFGLLKTNSANASLLSNFEIAATSLIAFLIFKEKISKKLSCAIILIIFASVILTYEGINCLEFSLGSVFVLIAYSCWGMENNCTKMISSKNTQEITIIKGIFSGLGSLIIAYYTGCSLPSFKIILSILLLGFFSYGLSVSMYIYSQNKLGAAKTAAYFSLAPYIGVLASVILLFEIPEIQFYIAFIIMIVAGILIYRDCKND